MKMQENGRTTEVAKIKRILLECTHTYETALNTGIQRVVRNIVNESKQIANEIGVECQPVVVKQCRFLAVEKIKDKPSLRACIIAFLKTVYRKFRPFLCAVLPFHNIEKFLFPPAGQFGLTTIINIVLDILLFPAELTVYFHNRIIPGKGDLLLLLDSSWIYPIWPAVRKAKDDGTIVGLIVYDIFQVTHPHLFVPAMVERFRVWFDQAIDNVDFFIAISQTTRDEVKRYVKSKRPLAKGTDRFESFQLGSVVDNVIRNGKVREELKKIFKSSSKLNPYLTVGTIEPRKNHKYLLDAFDEVWRQCPEARLCIVGCTGRLGDGLLKCIRSHPRYKKCLFMFNDLSDTELDYCYSHAKALVYPSYAEGFGLPLVEALYKRLPVLASDIPIFREVGKEFCAYFDISQSASLTKIIVNIEKEGKMPEVRLPAEYQLPDWKDSCRELLAKAVALCENL
jgi:alpha-1,2-rhamnosyltransferase